MRNIKKYISENYNHADLLVTVGVFALVFFAWRAAAVDLEKLGEGIALLLGGRGVHAAGKGWGEAQEGNSK